MTTSELSPAITPMFTRPASKVPAQSTWVHSIRKYGLRESIRKLQAVERDTVENLEALFVAHMEEAAKAAERTDGQ